MNRGSKGWGDCSQQRFIASFRTFAGFLTWAHQLIRALAAPLSIASPTQWCTNMAVA